jgi:hypothetical protein
MALTLVSLLVVGWLWWALLMFYGPIADAIKLQRLNSRSKTDGLDAHLDRFLEEVERRHGSAMREYISKQRWPIPKAIDFLNSQEIRKAAE